MEPYNLSLTFMMTSNAYLQPAKSSSEAQFQQKISTPKGKIELFASKNTTFLNQLTIKKYSDWF